MGIKKYFQGLEYPLEHSQEIIKKWKAYGTTKTLPRSGRPSKLDDKTRRTLIREATKKLITTLKEPHAFMGKTDHCVHVTISQALHKSGLYGRVARRKPLLKKIPP